MRAPLVSAGAIVVAAACAFVAYDGSWAPPVRFGVRVTAGSTYEIRVIGGWEPARTFELTTTFR